MLQRIKDSFKAEEETALPCVYDIASARANVQKHKILRTKQLTEYVSDCFRLINQEIHESSYCGCENIFVTISNRSLKLHNHNDNKIINWEEVMPLDTLQLNSIGESIETKFSSAGFSVAYYENTVFNRSAYNDSDVTEPILTSMELHADFVIMMKISWSGVDAGYEHLENHDIINDDVELDYFLPEHDTD